MSKQPLPTSYIVRQGDSRQDRRYRARRFRERTLRELGWLARAGIVTAALGAAVFGNVVPIVAVASNSSATVFLWGMVLFAAVVQMSIVGWLWLRSPGSAWSKLGWSVKLAVPVLGMLFFAAFYAMPDRNTGANTAPNERLYY